MIKVNNIELKDDALYNAILESKRFETIKKYEGNAFQIRLLKGNGEAYYILLDDFPETRIGVYSSREIALLDYNLTIGNLQIRNKKEIKK